MSVINLKVKCKQFSAKPALIRVLAENNVKFSRILFMKDEFFLVTLNDESDVAKVLSQPVTDELHAIHCNPVQPPELSAKKCLIVKFLDSTVIEHSDDELKLEIEDKNDVEIVDIYKFPNTKNMKVTFANHEMAKKCLQAGIRLFCFSVPTYNLVQDKFISVKFCFRCYEIDTHEASNCLKPAAYKICSDCSSTEHRYAECNSTIKKCINCDGDHSTMSFKCPARKDIEKQKRRSNYSNTYAQAVRQQNAVIPGNYLNSPETRDAIIRANISVMIAGYANNEQPGSFETVLNKLLASNGLPSFNMGDVQPPNFTIQAPTAASTVTAASSLPLSPQSVLANEPSSVSPLPSEVPSPPSLSLPSEVPSPASPVLPGGAHVQAATAQATRATTSRGGDAAQRSKAPEAKQASGTLGIRIYKEAGIKTVTKRTLKPLASKGKVIVHSKTLSEDKCLELLTDLKSTNEEIATCFANITELPADKFNNMLLRVSQNRK